MLFSTCIPFQGIWQVGPVISNVRHLLARWGKGNLCGAATPFNSNYLGNGLLAVL